MVLTYDQKHGKLRKWKLESMWYGPYIMSKVLEKGDTLLIIMGYLLGSLAMGCT